MWVKGSHKHFLIQSPRNLYLHAEKKKKKTKKKKKKKRKDFFQLVEVKGLTCQMLPPIQLFEHIDKIAIYFSLFFSTTI
jgi:hypothetical protein